MSGGTANKIAKQKPPPGLEDFAAESLQQNSSSSTQAQVFAPPGQFSNTRTNAQASPKRASQQPNPRTTNKQSSPTIESRDASGQNPMQMGGRGSPQQRQRQSGQQAQQSQQSQQSAARFQAPKPPGLQSSTRPPHAGQMQSQPINLQASLGRQPPPQQSQMQAPMQQMYGSSAQQASKQTYGARSPVDPDPMNQGGYPFQPEWHSLRGGEPSSRQGMPPHARMPVPEQQMLPSPGLPTGVGMPVMGPSVPQQQAQRQGTYSRHFADAISGSLQKFSHAEAMQKAAEARGITSDMAYGGANRSSQYMKSYSSYSQSPSMPMHGGYDDVEQRVQAQAQAEATAARLVAQNATSSQKHASSTQAKDEETSAPSDNAEKRFTGKIRSFNVGQGFGFIESVEVAKIHGCDVFLNQVVEGGVVVGSTVSFALELNKSGKPQARRVILEDTSTAKTSSPTKPFQELGSQIRGIQHQSKVKSFNTSRGFGFIDAPPDLKYSFGGRDIYVSKNQVPDGGLFVGQEVEFKLVVDAQGQPQARDVRVVPKTRGLNLPYTGLPFS